MRKFFLFFVIISIVTRSNGQVQFGVKGGLNFSTVAYINTGNSKARAGFNAGAMSEIPIQEDLFIRPELLYSSKGFAYNATGYANAGSLRLNYVAIPVLFGYHPFNKTSLLFGPEFGFLRKAAGKSQGITTDMTNIYRHFDIGVDLGATYDFSKTFGAEIRYNYGFKDLVNVVYLDAAGNIVSRGRNGANRVFQIGIYCWLSK